MIVFQMFFSQAAGNVTTNFLGIIIRVGARLTNPRVLYGVLTQKHRASVTLISKLSYTQHQTMLCRYELGKPPHLGHGILTLGRALHN